MLTLKKRQQLQLIQSFTINTLKREQSKQLKTSILCKIDKNLFKTSNLK